MRFLFGRQEQRAPWLFGLAVDVPYRITHGRRTLDKASTPKIGRVTIDHANPAAVLQLVGTDVELIAFVDKFVLRHWKLLIERVPAFRFSHRLGTSRHQ
jgi:hypothetical protein